MVGWWDDASQSHSIKHVWSPVGPVGFILLILMMLVILLMLMMSVILLMQMMVMILLMLMMLVILAILVIWISDYNIIRWRKVITQSTGQVWIILCEYKNVSFTNTCLPKYKHIYKIEINRI